MRHAIKVRASLTTKPLLLNAAELYEYNKLTKNVQMFYQWIYNITKHNIIYIPAQNDISKLIARFLERLLVAGQTSGIFSRCSWI